MGKTKRDKIRGKYRAEDRKYDKESDKKIERLRKTKNMDLMSAYHLVRINDPWSKLSFKEQQKIFPGYSKNPSWWNRIFNRKPKRREDRDKLKKIDLKTETDGIIFTDDNKPNKYYW